jgi:hypothetical protein
MATMFAARGTTNQLFRIQKSGPQLKNTSSVLQIRDANDANYNALESASLAVNLGSVSSPSISFNGDPNTGIYSPAADALALTRGGFEALRIDTQGNIRLTNGSFASLGDAAVVQYILRATTTNATQTEMLINGVDRMVLANDSTWKFDISVVARRTDVNNENAAYTLRGCIYRDANAASTTIAGIVNKNVDAEQDLDWDVAADADTTNGSLRLQVTGEAAKTIRWVAFVTATQVVEI